MGSTLWFISLLKEQPWVGFLVGLLFVSIMFGSKNIIIYLYSRNQQKKRTTDE